MKRSAGFPLVVAAPSGTGKTTVCRALVARDPGLVFSVSHTTRERRPKEQDGRDYHFVSQAEFGRMIEAGEFLEWAVYNDHHYGTSFAAIEAPLAEGRVVVLEIEVQGARQVRATMPEAVAVFIGPPSRAALRARLVGRGTDSPEQVDARLRTAERELEAQPEFAHVVVNDRLEEATAELAAIVRSALADGRS